MIPEQDAIDHFKRTGCILPDHQGTIAAWLAENNGPDGREG